MALSNNLRLDMARRLESAAAHAGAMIALIPDDFTAHRLAVPGYEPVEQLHVTVAFLGKADAWDDHHRLVASAAARTVAESIDAPVVGKLWAAGSFNPRGEEPCAAYLVGEVNKLTYVHRTIWSLLDKHETPAPSQHKPWIPHLTIGYGLPVTAIESQAFGEVRFDRLRVAFGPDHWDFKLP